MYSVSKTKLLKIPNISSHEQCLKITYKNTGGHKALHRILMQN